MRTETLVSTLSAVRRRLSEYWGPQTTGDKVTISRALIDAGLPITCPEGITARGLIYGAVTRKFRICATPQQLWHWEASATKEQVLDILELAVKAATRRST